MPLSLAGCHRLTTLPSGVDVKEVVAHWGFSRATIAMTQGRVSGFWQGKLILNLTVVLFTLINCNITHVFNCVSFVCFCFNFWNHQMVFFVSSSLCSLTPVSVPFLFVQCWVYVACKRRTPQILRLWGWTTCYLPRVCQDQRRVVDQLQLLLLLQQQGAHPRTAVSNILTTEPSLLRSAKSIMPS